MKLINAYKKIQKINEEVDPIPWETGHLFQSILPDWEFEIRGDQICLGEDDVSIADARAGIAWIVDQLGGKVEWESDDG